MQEGYLISIPSRGRSREEYRAARVRMKAAGLTDRINQFDTKEQAEAAIQRYRHCLPTDAAAVPFMTL